MCGRDANDNIHVTPHKGGLMGSSMMPILSADTAHKNHPTRAHGFMLSSPSLTAGITCQTCGETINSGIHTIGLPSGMVPLSSNSGLYGSGLAATLSSVDGNAHKTTNHPFVPKDQGALAVDECAECGLPRDAKVHIAKAPLSKQTAFVAEIGHRLVFAAPVTTEFDNSQLPREVASAWEKAKQDNPYFMWIAGRYVEADRPNRNSAYWSTADLELGQPTVTHGPINWLHEERHIVGAIAGSEMVHVDKETASASGVGNHIVMLGAIWSHIYPQEANVIQRASENGKLWASMECVSQEVACLACNKTMGYADYMKQEARCDHMRQGMPRRFKDPTFGGVGIIVPPVRPGWANADVRVLMPQAAKLAESQAASFGGMSTLEAEEIVAQILGSVAE